MKPARDLRADVIRCVRSTSDEYIPRARTDLGIANRAITHARGRHSIDVDGKPVDKASAKLFEACCKGTHIPKLKLQVNRAGGDKVTYLMIDMEEVVVSSVNFSAGGDKATNDKEVSDLPTEEIKFNFARIKTTYTQQKRTDGQGGGNVVGGWDRSKNTTFA